MILLKSGPHDNSEAVRSDVRTLAQGTEIRVPLFRRGGIRVPAIAAFVALGAQVADPIIGLVITVLILRIAWQSWRTVSTTEPGEMIDAPE